MKKPALHLNRKQIGPASRVTTLSGDDIFFPVDVHVEDLSFRGCFFPCFESLYPFSALVFLQGSQFAVRSSRGYASSWIALVSFRFPWASKLMFLI